MEPIHVKEALFLLDRAHLFAIQNEGYGSLQHATEGIINMVEGITIRSKKQTLILIFFSWLTILKIVFGSIQYKNGWLTPSDLFHMFTQSIKFHNIWWNILLSRIKSTDVSKM